MTNSEDKEKTRPNFLQCLIGAMSYMSAICLALKEAGGVDEESEAGGLRHDIITHGEKVMQKMGELCLAACGKEEFYTKMVEFGVESGLCDKPAKEVKP